MNGDIGSTQIGLLTDKVKFILETVAKDLITVAGTIVIIMIVVGGIQYVTGGAEAGKKTIVAALIGTAIIVFTYAIISIVINLFYR